MTCFSYEICVYHFWYVLFFPGILFRSRVTEACPMATDLILRIKARTILGLQTVHTAT